MVFGVLKPTAEEWLIFQRMSEGEHLYIDGFEGNPQTDPFTMTGRLARSPEDQRVTNVDGRTLNSMRDGRWIVYNRDLNECVLTHQGNETLRLYRPSTTSNRTVTKKPSER